MAKKQTGAIKRKIKETAQEAVYFVIYRALYITGLAILIPMVFAFAFNEQGPWYSSPLTYFFTSVFLIAVSFFGMFWRKRSFSKTLKSLAKMSLIPGGIALVLFVFGRGILYSILRIAVPKFESFEPLFTTYLDSAIPKMGVLLIGYLVVGAALYAAGMKLKK